MKRAHWWTTGLLLVASLGTAQAQKPVDLEVQFKAAERKELVDGDLKGAIEQYRQIVAKAGTNRSVAAKALLRMAECYQKQGDVEARKIYERLVRDFADQRDAASIAQARLGNASSTDRVAAMSLRKLSTTDVFGAVSYDGRYLTYVDWIDGNLMLRDLATGSERPVTGLPPGSSPKLGDFAEESAISRDGAQVAFTWYDAASRRYELRVTSTKGPGVQPARRSTAPCDLRPEPHRWQAVRSGAAMR